MSASPLILCSAPGSIGRKAKQGFAARHGCTMLVWFELHASMTTAIMREKQIKTGSRARKLALIEADNAAWRDVLHQIL